MAITSIQISKQRLKGLYSTKTKAKDLTKRPFFYNYRTVSYKTSVSISSSVSSQTIAKSSVNSDIFANANYESKQLLILSNYSSSIGIVPQAQNIIGSSVFSVLQVDPQYQSVVFVPETEVVSSSLQINCNYQVSVGSAEDFDIKRGYSEFNVEIGISPEGLKNIVYSNEVSGITI